MVLACQLAYRRCVQGQDITSFQRDFLNNETSVS